MRVFRGCGLMVLLGNSNREIDRDLGTWVSPSLGSHTLVVSRHICHFINVLILMRRDQNVLTSTYVD